MIIKIDKKKSEEWLNNLKRKADEDEKLGDYCFHLACSKCQGTRRDEFGRACIHMISCPCKRCTPIYKI